MPQKAQVDLEFLAKGLDKIEARVDALNRKQVKLGITTPNLNGSSSSSRGNRSSGGSSRASGGSNLPLGKISGDINQITKSLEAANARTLSFLVSASGIAAVITGFKSFLATTIQVEQQLANINVIFNLTDKSLQKFSSQLFQVAKDTGTTFTEVATAATELARQGLGVVETQKRVADALTLSKLSGLDAAASVDAITTALNSFTNAGLDSTQVVNKLAAVDQAFAVSSKDLADAISRVGSSAVDAGVDFDQLLGLVSAARQITGRSGSVIGNSFKTIFTRLQRSQVASVLEGVGVATQNEDGSLKTQIELLSDLAKVYDTLSPRVKSYVAEQVGGVFQINVLKATLGDLGKQYSIYDAALKKSQGATDEAQQKIAKLTQTYQGQFNALGQSITQFSANFGKLSLGGVFDNLLAGGNSIFNTLNADLEKAGEGGGTSFGVGLAKGLGQFLQGPVLAGLTLIIGKLLVKLIGDATKALGAISTLGGGKAGGLGKKFAIGGLAVSGIADLISGFAGPDSKIGAGASAVGNAATGASIGSLAGPIGAVVGGLAGLLLSTNTLANAFDEAKVKARESTKRAEETSSAASAIQDLFQNILSTNSQISEVKSSGGADSGAAIVKLQDQQVTNYQKLNENLGALGIKGFSPLGKTTEQLTQSFSELLNIVTDVTKQSTFEAALDQFASGGLTEDKITKIIADRLKGQNLTGLNRGTDVEKQTALSKALNVQYELLDGLFKRAGYVEEQSGRRVFTEEGSSQARSIVTGATKQELERRKLAEKVEKQDKIQEKNSNKQIIPTVNILEKSLDTLTQAIVNISNIIGNKSREIDQTNFKNTLTSNRLGGIKDNLSSLGQDRAALKLGSIIDQLDARNAFSNETKQNNLDLNQSIANDFISSVKELKDSVLKNAAAFPDNSVAQKDQLDALNRLVENNLPKILGATGNELKSVITSLIPTLKSESLNILKDDGVGGNSAGFKLLDSVQMAISENGQKNLDALQKLNQSSESIKQSTQILAQKAQLQNQQNLFGGLGAFLDPSQQAGKLQTLQQSVLANNFADKNLDPNNPKDALTLARLQAQRADATNNFFGGKVGAGGNQKNIAGGLAEQAKQEFNDFVKTIIGQTNYQNYFGGTRGGAADEVITRGTNLRNTVGGFLSSSSNNQLDAATKYLKDNVTKGFSGVGDVQAAALTDEVFIKEYKDGVQKIVDAIREENARAAQVVSQLPQNTANNTSNISLNIAVNGSFDQTTMKAIAKEAFDPVAAKLKAHEEAIRSGDKTRLNLPPSSNPVINQNGVVVS